MVRRCAARADLRTDPDPIDGRDVTRGERRCDSLDQAAPLGIELKHGRAHLGEDRFGRFEQRPQDLLQGSAACKLLERAVATPQDLYAANAIEPFKGSDRGQRFLGPSVGYHRASQSIP